MIVVRRDDPTSPAAAEMIRWHAAATRAYSPANYAFVLDTNALAVPGVLFFTAWSEDALAGMGALKDLDRGHAEVKSMRTHPDHLRKGVGAAVLQALIDAARAEGFGRLSLETGTGEPFAPARALYRRFGFIDCPAFADYPPDSLHNQYMTLTL